MSDRLFFWLGICALGCISTYFTSIRKGKDGLTLDQRTEKEDREKELEGKGKPDYFELEFEKCKNRGKGFRIEKEQQDEREFIDSVKWGEGGISQITDEEIEKVKTIYPNESNGFICGKILWYRGEAERRNSWKAFGKHLQDQVDKRFERT